MNPAFFLRKLTPKLFLFFLTAVFAHINLAGELFPEPPELERDITFWLSVYSEIDTRSGYLHDAYDLSVVYETLTLTGHRPVDEKTIKSARQRIAGALERLATERKQPSQADAHILSRWGGEVTADQLRKAAANVRFQRGQSERFRAGLERSGQWLDHIHGVLKARKLPLELAALPHVESSFNPEAYSSVGAAGIWQFTRSTGRRYLHIDYVVDERMDPFSASSGAAQLLEHNLQLTGTWPLALTAYNHGASGVRRASKQLGTTDIAPIVRNYRGRAFGFASRNFYVSFVAALKISENPQQYFPGLTVSSPIDYASIETQDFLLVDSFARAFNTDLDQLKQHNRSLLEPVWRGKKRIPEGFTLRIPRVNMNDTAENLLAAIPADQRFSEQTPDLFHKVVPGDTVSEIASRYGHGIRDVAAMNGLNRRYQIRIGQVLRLPLEGATASAEIEAAAVPEAHQPSVAALSEESPPLASDDNAESESAENSQLINIQAEMSADPADYTVGEDNSIEIQASETLGHYAEWLDMRASDLRRLNDMPYGGPLVIGHRLKLDFSRAPADEFERRRMAYQHDLQQSFFMTWQIQATHIHVIAPGESLWVLTRRKFKIPMWLLRQYNPDLDLDRLHPGAKVVVPELGEA